MTIICAVILAGCGGDDKIEPKWEYGGPIPEILDGPSAAQKMCYQLYTKYDLHVYYTLSAGDAAQTPLGVIQSSKISAANPQALPFVAASEESAEIFLKMLTGFYSVLPDELVSACLYRRQILVKVNPTRRNKIKDQSGKFYPTFSHTEDQKGIIVFGYMDKNEDEANNNTLIDYPNDWKWEICYQFFRGQVYETQKKNVDFPNTFEPVSKGLYMYDFQAPPELAIYVRGSYVVSAGKECGFVHPFGGLNSWTGTPYADWGTYAAWIMTVPYEERSVDIEKWPRIKTKYEIVMDYYKKKFNVDLEKVGVEYRNLVI